MSTEEWWTRFEDAKQLRRRSRRRYPGLIALAIVLVLGAGGGLLWRSAHQSAAAHSPGGSSAQSTHSPDPSALRRLQELLPPGYSPRTCSPAPAPEEALATLVCGKNSDAGGPTLATFTIVGDDAALRAVFLHIAGGITPANCPGDIPSPGPWRRQTASGRINGILLCGYGGGGPSIAWTANDQLLVGAVQADTQALNLDGLFAWWSSRVLNA